MELLIKKKNVQLKMLTFYPWKKFLIVMFMFCLMLIELVIVNVNLVRIPLFILQIIYYNRINLNEGTDINQSNNINVLICHY